MKGLNLSESLGLRARMHQAIHAADALGTLGLTLYHIPLTIERKPSHSSEKCQYIKVLSSLQTKFNACKTITIIVGEVPRFPSVSASTLTTIVMLEILWTVFIHIFLATIPTKPSKCGIVTQWRAIRWRAVAMFTPFMYLSSCSGKILSTCPTVKPLQNGSPYVG